jgi:hypothetical protein
MKFHQIIFRALLRLLVGRRHNVISFYGMRRSGNHACIEWVKNAVSESNQKFVKAKDWHFQYTGEGSVFFINEANMIQWRYLFQQLFAMRKVLNNSKYIFISFEDTHPDCSDNWRDIADKKIIIKRNILDVIASRYHNLNKRARNGIGWQRQSIDGSFFDTMNSFNATANTASSLVWDYDQWVNGKDYRRSFLGRIGLNHDEMPGVSSLGGGSSFIGATASVDALNNIDRASQVEPFESWIHFINKLVSNYPDHFEKPDLERVLKLSSPSSGVDR